MLTGTARSKRSRCVIWLVWLTLMLSSQIAWSQAVKMGDEICGSLVDVGKYAGGTCRNSINFLQEHHEFHLSQATRRSSNPQELIEQEQVFLDSLFRCDTSECVRLAYVSENARLEAIDESAFLYQYLMQEEESLFDEAEIMEMEVIADEDLPPVLDGVTTRQEEATILSYEEKTAGSDSVRNQAEDSTNDVGAQVHSEVVADKESVMSGQMMRLALWGVLAIVLLALLLAATDQVVFFYDSADAWWSIAPFIFMVVGGLIVNSLAPEGADGFATTSVEKMVWGLAVLASAGAILITYRNAINYNRSFLLGFVVGTLKVAVSAFMAMTVIGQFSRVTDDKSTRRQKSVALMILALIGILWAMLVNGPRVYRNKGWVSGGLKSSGRLTGSPGAGSM